MRQLRLYIDSVLCGDLNTMPSNQPYAMDTYDKQTLSAPFELFTTGQLSCQHPEHPDKYYMQVRNGIHPKLGPLKSHFKLTNIYSKSEFEIQKPLFTTKTDDFSGWIDHIWVNDIVDVSHVLVPPIRAGDLDANMKARSFAPIPGLFFPSDHLPIGMTVTLKGLSNE
jgi:endonuclease/exonuclease/phosphatase family metal-dependent hydrolase